jgi:DNA-binding MarR family transcriptional regulator
MQEDEALASRLLETAPIIMRFIHKALRDTDLRVEPNQYQLLQMLAHHDFTVSELARKRKVTLPSMSKTVNAMVERGWVERLDVPGDRRVVQVRLTEEGRGAMREAREPMLRIVLGALSTLGDDEKQTLSDGLDVLHVAFGGPLIRPDEWGSVAAPPAVPVAQQTK